MVINKKILQNSVDAKSKTQNKLVPITNPNVPHLHAQMTLQVEIQKNQGAS